MDIPCGDCGARFRLDRALLKDANAAVMQERPLPGAFAFPAPAAKTYFGQSPSRCATSSSFDA